MAFNVGDGVTNGELAVNLIGQTSWTSYTGGTTQSSFNNPSYGIAYNASTSELYINDYGNNRIMAFNGTELAKKL